MEQFFGNGACPYWKSCQVKLLIQKKEKTNIYICLSNASKLSNFLLCTVIGNWFQYSKREHSHVLRLECLAFQ